MLAVQKNFFLGEVSNENSSSSSAGVPYSAFECDAAHEGYLSELYVEEDPNYWWEADGICINNNFVAFINVYSETYNCTGELSEMVHCTPIPGTEGEIMVGIKTNYVKYWYVYDFQHGLKTEDDISVSTYMYHNGAWVKITTSSSSVAISSSSQEGASSSDNSSSSQKSSSSGEPSSSSSGPCSNILDGEYDASTNTMYDCADKKTYKTATIGGKVWMAENLRRGKPVVEDTLCPGDGSSYRCRSSGYLYGWCNVLFKGSCTDSEGFYNKVETYFGNSVCPGGWHLPSVKEFNALHDVVGDYGTDDYTFEKAGYVYLSHDETDYNYIMFGKSSFYWTTDNTETEDSMAIFGERYEDYGVYYDIFGRSKRKAYAAVRCVKD